MKWSVNRGNWFQGWGDCHQPAPSWTATFLLLLLLPPSVPPPPPPLLPPLSSLSNSLRQRSAEAVRGHQKGTQTQREMPSAYKNETRSGSIQFTPLAQHQSTSIHQHHHRRASESAALRGPTLWLASSLSHGGWAYFTKALLLKDWDATQSWFTDLLWVWMQTALASADGHLWQRHSYFVWSD